MAKAPSKTSFKSEFLARTKAAREARGLTQNQISSVLGIEQGRYKQYETRTYLPYDMIEVFCLVCGIEPTWLVTGKGRMAALPAARAEADAKRDPKKAGKAA